MPTNGLPTPRLKPVHGPFFGKSKLYRNLGPTLRAELTQQINDGECPCELCKKHGQRPLPPAYMWARMRDPRKPNAWLNARPCWVFPKSDIKL